MDQHVEAVKHYIREHTRAGISTDAAIAQLRAAGWPDPYIQQALHELRAESAPAAPAGHLQYQSASPLQPTGVLAKASLNPFAHISRGVTQLLQSNTAVTVGFALGIIVINAIAAVVMVAFFFITILAASAAGESGSIASFPWSLPVALIGVILIYALLNGYIILAFNRLILLGSRREKATLGQLARFSLKRYPKLILTYLFIVAAVIAAFAVGTLAAVVLPKPFDVIVSVLFNVTALVFAVIYGLRISFINLVIADTPVPGSPMHIIRHSTAVWRRSAGAVTLYWLAIMGIYILFSMISGASGSVLHMVPSTSASSSLPWLGALPGFLLPMLIFTLVQIGTIAGFADIYTEVVHKPAH